VAKAKERELTWKEAIEHVLASSSSPLHYREITEKIITEGLRKTVGATPAATVCAHITSSIKHEGENSPYIKVARGVFALRSETRSNHLLRSQSSGSDFEEESAQEEQYDIITSFGMFWRRDAVEWTSKPKLLGMQQIGATPVNFSAQLGVYLLYDSREIIYVGRAIERPLGKRLYEHTIDRLAARWDRFSWFGLLPVSEKGELGTLPEKYSASKMIPALEAILIEALEPPQNRKRGDDLSAVEYLQKVDPDIEKRRLKAAIDKI